MSIYAIERIKIIGTNLYTYTAWECDDEQHFAHSTIKHIGAVCYGQVSSRRLPAYIEAIPLASDARLAAVRSWQADRDAAERRLIEIAFPETHGSQPRMAGGCEIERDPALPAQRNERRWIAEPACPGIITSRQRAYEVACWIDEVLAEGEHITLNTIAISRIDDRLIVAGRPGHWTPAELADLIFWPARKEVNDALRTYYLTSGATPMSTPTISEIYAHFTAQADPWAIASTSTAALASDIADLIGDEHATGYPTDGAGSVDLYALARQVQQMAAAEAAGHRPDEATIAALLAERWPAVPFTVTISTIDQPGDPTHGETWLEITWPPAGIDPFAISTHLQHLVGDHDPALFDCVKCHSKRTQEATR